jgi:hypothetical protein
MAPFSTNKVREKDWETNCFVPEKSFGATFVFSWGRKSSPFQKLKKPPARLEELEPVCSRLLASSHN